MHASAKIAACDIRIPATAGVYYPWFYVLCDCNGSFEMTSPRVIWAQVSQGLPFLTQLHVSKILEQFHQNGLLFVWQAAGKSWGHWTGSNASGRLPKPSHRERYAVIAPPVPKDLLEEYIKRFAFNSITHERDVSPVQVPVGVGIGFGLGIGVGEGDGVLEDSVSHPLFLIWQEERGQLPEVLELTKNRLSKCRVRISNHASDPERFLADFRKAVHKASQNAFLTGQSSSGDWKASFDWFIGNDENYLKVLEGKYDGGGNGRTGSTQNGTDARKTRADERRERTQQALEAGGVGRSQLVEYLHGDVPSTGVDAGTGAGLPGRTLGPAGRQTS